MWERDAKIIEELTTRGIVRSTPDEKKEEVGVKFDTNKERLDLIPSEAIFALGAVLTYGANKYSSRNWENGMEWGRVFGAAMRHLWTWWGAKETRTRVNFLFGELDEETEFSHLWHAFACIAFLITYEERRIGTDTRST